ncbi:hypothetical protein KSC_010450 [Ktedonobacter sp. SOSP1-52]|uniref:hypothetical protein n=1 Tax=Ktedonobacter sp. SOSP1-52 TaxID=2778366 RepID=UPI0019164D3A|nr:hypothetical protein [Ktedonobacter sp. SOSP1-52]GHO62153.1 hypothetical protein KSC_010450 [Ktedonobacter sp. SOSP1-52]
MTHYTNNYNHSEYGSTPAYAYDVEHINHTHLEMETIKRLCRQDADTILLDLSSEYDDYADYGSGGPAQAYLSTRS